MKYIIIALIMLVMLSCTVQTKVPGHKQKASCEERQGMVGYQ